MKSELRPLHLQFTQTLASSHPTCLPFLEANLITFNCPLLNSVPIAGGLKVPLLLTPNSCKTRFTTVRVSPTLRPISVAKRSCVS